MKSFCVRVINVVVIVLLLCGYNVTVHAREKADEIARLDAELQNTKIQMANAQAAGNDSHAGQGENTANGGAQTANSAGKYKDGTWQGSAEGFGGNIAVDVIISGGEITSVDITSADGEDSAYLSMAKDIIPKIIDAQSAEVDTISGATFSSTGIKNAVAQALEGAVQ